MAYDPSEPRDYRGRWTDSGAGLPKTVAKALADSQERAAKRGTGLQFRAYEFATKEDAQAASNRLARVIGQGVGAARRENYVISAAPTDVVESIRGTPAPKTKRASGNRVAPTYDLAMAAGKDAANASMRAAGRTHWNEEDYNAMASTVDKILGPSTPASHIVKAPPHDAAPINGATGKPVRHR